LEAFLPLFAAIFAIEKYQRIFAAIGAIEDEK
jgi:hypothetical protein